MARRVGVFIYGLLCYAMSLGVFLYAFGFIGNVLVPKSIDSPREGSIAAVLLVNLGLLGLFALQHSVMARPTFKQWWTRFVPMPAERSTYVLATNLCLILLFWQWRPMGGVVWDVQDPLGAASSTFCMRSAGSSCSSVHSSSITSICLAFGRCGCVCAAARVHASSVQNPGVLPIHPSPTLRWLVHGLLVDADDDARPPRICTGEYRVHPDRDSVRGCTISSSITERCTSIIAGACRC